MSGAEPEDGLVSHGLVASEVAPPPAALDHGRPYRWSHEFILEDRFKPPEDVGRWGGCSGAVTATVSQIYP